MNLATILIWLVDSIGARVLTSLGIGFISFAAVNTAANALIGSFSSNWSSITPIVLNLLSLAGFPAAFGWILGAILAKLSLASLSKIGRLPT